MLAERPDQCEVRSLPDTSLQFVVEEDAGFANLRVVARGGYTMKTAYFSAFCVFGLLIGAVDASAITFCKNATDRDCFTGSFGLVDKQGDPHHKLLLADFGYVDPGGAGWQTNKGAETDGASIPPLLQPFVGTSWEEGYIRAAVIHDWYCDRHVRSWKETHRVFYDAMVASGLKKAKAKLLFYAVYAFGPRWGYIAPGTKCEAGTNCIQTTGSVWVQMPSQYNDITGSQELKAMEATIDLTEGSNDGLSLDQLMAIADRSHPRQSLLTNPPTAGGATK